MFVADEPLTRQDLLNAVAELKSHVDGRVEKTETALKTYVDERSEKVETKLLTAFHGWARAMEIKVRGMSTLTTGFDERLSMLEERVAWLERKAG